MTKLEQLLANLTAIDAKIDELLAADTLTDEAKAEHDKLVNTDRPAAVKAIETEKNRLTDAAKRKAERDAIATAAQAAAVQAAPQRQTSATAGTPDPEHPENANDEAPAVFNRIPAVHTGRASIIPKNIRRTGRLRAFRGNVNGFSADERAYRFGMWALARISQNMPGRYSFKQAIAWVDKNIAAVGGNDVSGNYNLIPEEFGTDIIDLREKYGKARKLLRVLPMTSDTRTDPRRQGGLTAYFVSEGGAGTESSKVWDNVRLTAKEVMVLSRYTNQLNADAVINIGDDLAYEISYAYANKEDDCAFNGTGASTYGAIQGVRAKLADCDGAGTASAGLTTMTSNAWTSATLKDFQLLVGKLPEYADTEEACWVCHRAFYYGVMQVLELAAGGVTAAEVQTGDRRPRPLFLGYPVEFSQVWPSTNAATQVSVALGDFSLGARFGDRQLDEIAFSEHASIGGENVFERNQVAIRGIERFDINVHDVGTASTPGPIVGMTT
jgi:HK97 family phage major capsid protein